MKKIILITVASALISTLTLDAQNTNWVKPFMGNGNTADVIAYDVDVDASNNSFVVGSFKGTVDFNQGNAPATSLTSAGDYDIFIAKYSSAGALSWVHRIGGTLDDRAIAVDVDAAGNVLVGGDFKSTSVDFDPGSGTASASSLNGNRDMFILKLNTSGAYAWSQTIGGTNDEYMADIETDQNNNVYFSGNFNALTDFVGNTNTLPHGNNGTYDAFLLKLNSSGAYQWVKAIGGDGNDYAQRITAVGPSLVYLCSTIGAASTTFDFGNGSYGGTFSGSTNNGIVSEFNSGTGAYNDGCQFTGNTKLVKYYNSGSHATAIGEFSGTMDADPLAGTTTLSSATSGTNIFMISLNQATYAYSDHRNISPSVTNGRAYVWDADFQPGSNSGNYSVYLTGSYRGSVDFGGTSTAVDVTGNTGYEGSYVAKYNFDAITNKDFDLLYVHANTPITATTETSRGRGIAIKPNGDLVTCGYFASIANKFVDFEPTALTIQYKSGFSAACGFLQNIEACTVPTLTVVDGIGCGPGTVSLNASAGSGNVVRWYASSTGGTVLKTGNGFTTPSISSTTTYYVQGSNSSGGCLTAFTPVVANVYQKPNVTSATSKSICAGASVNLPLTSDIPSTLRWVAVSSTPIFGESTTLQTGSTINDGLNTVSLVPETITYNVTAIATNGGCASSTQAVTITVNPLPQMMNTATKTICSGASVNQSLVPNLSATTTWIAASNAQVAGESTTLKTGATINDVLSITSTTPQTVTYTVTPTSTIGGSCVGPTQTITITVNPTPTITSPNTVAICSGASVNLPLTSNITSSYSWIAAANANVVGESTAAVSSSTINNTLTSNATTPQQITYTVTPTSGGCAGTTATVVVTVNPKPTVTSGQSITTCSGVALNFPLTSGVAGTTFDQIATDNTLVTGEPLTTITGNAITNTLSTTSAFAQTVNYTITPKVTATGCTGASQAIVVTVNPAVTGAATITASQTNVCVAGTNVTFNVSNLTGGGTTPVYQWKLNNSNVGTNSATYNTTALVSGDQVKCVITSNATCVSSSTITSNTITITSTGTVTPTIAIGNSSSVCAGQSVQFSSVITDGGANPSYQWKLNGNNVGANTATHTFSSLNNGDIVTCVLTSSASCLTTSTVTSNSFTVTVTANPTIVSALNDTACLGTNAILTATASSGAYVNWYTTSSGGNNPTSSNTIAVVNINANTTYYAEAVLNAGTCKSVTRTPVTAVVKNPTVPTITINASSTSVCSGSSVTFTSSITEGGASPTYKWYKNGQLVSGNATYSSILINSGDQIYCELTSSATCVNPSITVSNTITMTNGNVTPTVTVSSSQTSYCAGSIATFTATPTNGGNAPAYQWKLNGNNVGSNSANYSSSTLTDGDQVSCTMTSNASCVSTTTANSAAYTVSIDPTPNIAVTNSSGTLTATQTAATYQWIDCSNNGSISGANAISYSPTASGSYAVILNLNGCIDTSACQSVIISSINKASLNSLISIYPNPSKGQFMLKNSTSINLTYTVTDVIGKVITTGLLIGSENVIDLSTNKNGFYFISISDGNSLSTFKLILEE